MSASQGNNNSIVADIGLNGNKLTVSYLDSSKKEIPIPVPDLSGYYTKAQIDALLAGLKWNSTAYPHGPVVSASIDQHRLGDVEYTDLVIRYSDGTTVRQNIATD